MFLPKQKVVVRSVRLDADLNNRVERAAKEHGFSNPSAFIREVIQRAVSGQASAVEAAEQRIAASIDRTIGEIRKVRRAQQATFAFADAQIKMLLTCVPEPSKEVYDQALARGKLRYDRFLKSVGLGMVGDSAASIQELMNHAEEA
jgi:Arc/MetJ-type ribon-helix-helix transcriptional regulator